MKGGYYLLISHHIRQVACAVTFMEQSEIPCRIVFWLFRKRAPRNKKVFETTRQGPHTTIALYSVHYLKGRRRDVYAVTISVICVTTSQDPTRQSGFWSMTCHTFYLR